MEEPRRAPAAVLRLVLGWVPVEQCGQVLVREGLEQAADLLPVNSVIFWMSLDLQRERCDQGQAERQRISCREAEHGRLSFRPEA
jgi:hypothetical protein